MWGGFPASETQPESLPPPISSALQEWLLCVSSIETSCGLSKAMMSSEARE